MTLDAAGTEFVGFDLLVTIEGGDSRMIIRPHPGINQYDFIGEMHIGPGSHLELADNVPIRLYSDSHSWGRIEGWGEIQVNSPTPFNNSGVINPGSGGLRFEQIWSGELLPFDLDGSLDFGQVWLNVPFSILEINASALADPFDGVLNMDPGTLLTMNVEDGWQMEGSLNATGGISNAAAQINGADLTVSGTVNVVEEGMLRVLADATVEADAATWIFADSWLEYDGPTTVEAGGSACMTALNWTSTARPSCAAASSSPTARTRPTASSSSTATPHTTAPSPSTASPARTAAKPP